MTQIEGNVCNLRGTYVQKCIQGFTSVEVLGETIMLIIERNKLPISTLLEDQKS